MKQKLRKVLDSLLEDRESGSISITNGCISAILNHLQKSEEDITILKSELMEALTFLKEHFNQFMAIFHFAECFEKELWQERSRQQLIAFIEDYLNKWAQTDQLIANNTIKLLDFHNKTILMHSQSYTLKILISKLREQNIKVKFIQTESRPAMEGRLQAEYAANLGYPVTFIADAAVNLYIDQIDFVMMGADRVEDHHFINKIGSCAIALICKEHKVPFYVISDSRKLSAGQVKMKKESVKPAAELWDTKHPDIHARNYYYEQIPNRLITKLITESNPF